MNQHLKLAYDHGVQLALADYGITKEATFDLLLGYLAGQDSDLPDFEDIPRSNVLAAGGLGGFALGEHLRKTRGASKGQRTLTALAGLLGGGAAGAAVLGKAHDNAQ